MCISNHGGGRHRRPPRAVCTQAPIGVPALGGVSARLPSGWVGAWIPGRLRRVGAHGAARVSFLLVSGRKTDVAVVKLFLIRHA